MLAGGRWLQDYKGRGWSRVHAAAASRQVHVYPTYGRDHDTDDADAPTGCWCIPQALIGDDGIVIVHRDVN